nr:hypothetical protein [Tanacetum cinerariifolium]
VRGYCQEEGIDFEESFTTVARMEAVRIFLAYATHKSFTVFQMDVKTAFLHGTIDPTLFIRRFDGDILVAHVYVDDIIFGSTHPSEILTVWVLVLAPDNIKPLTLKWLFKNKHDEENTVIRNNTRLVVRGYCQEEGIDFEESFTTVARMEAVRIFLAYAAHKSFTVFQMDVKTVFLHGTIDPTLFIRRFDGDILVAHVYVDDIIFVNQSPCGIFINQSNYVLEIFKKYEMETCDPVGTPMKIKDKLDLDQNGTPVDATKYRSMIGALMYLTSSRPDIVYATCLCARYQAKPIEKHLKEVKRIFCYLWGTVNTGL